MNAKLHNASAFTDNPQLIHWMMPKTQRSIIRSYETEFRPLSTLSHTSKIEFLVPVAHNEFINFSKSMFWIKLRFNLKKANNTKVEASEWTKVTCVNYLLHAMFANDEVTISNKDTIQSPPTYGYRAIIDAELGYSSDAKKAHLTSAFYFTNPTDRTLRICGSQSNPAVGSTIELMGVIHRDLAVQGRPLPGGTEYKITLTPADPNFYTICQQGYSLIPEFLDCGYYILKHEVSPDFLVNYKQNLAKQPAVFPMSRIEVKQLTIPSGQLEVQLDNVVNGHLPRKMIVFMTDSDASNGSPQKDPFEFKHNNISYLATYLNGVQYPHNALTMDFDNKMVIRAYTNYCQNLGQFGYDCLQPKSYDEWMDNPLFVFNFSPDLSHGMMSGAPVSLQQYGNLRMHMRFKSPLPKTTTVNCYLQFDSVLSLDSNLVPQ